MKYRLYIDEVGNPGLTAAEEPNQRYVDIATTYASATSRLEAGAPSASEDIATTYASATSRLG